MSYTNRIRYVFQVSKGREVSKQNISYTLYCTLKLKSGSFKLFPQRHNFCISALRARCEPLSFRISINQQDNNYVDDTCICIKPVSSCFRVTGVYKNCPSPSVYLSRELGFCTKHTGTIQLNN